MDGRERPWLIVKGHWHRWSMESKGWHLNCADRSAVSPTPEQIDAHTHETMRFLRLKGRRALKVEGQRRVYVEVELRDSWSAGLGVTSRNRN